MKEGRNLRVFLGRAFAEAQPGKVTIATIFHDDGCPGLKSQSMLSCTCKPEITYEQFRPGMKL